MKRIILPTLVLLLVILPCGCNKKSPEPAAQPEPVKITVGHVGHDHHLALFVAFDNAGEYRNDSGIGLNMVEDQKFYELTDLGRKIADIEIVKVGGGSKMPTALARRVIDIGLGGVAAVLASIDSGSDIKLISPLHSKGDMFIAGCDFPAATWQEFVELAKNTDKPLRIGYKDPVAVAKVIFEEALRCEGITFSGDLADSDVKVHMINTKGGDKLNVSLGAGLVDAYVGNNPFPSVAVEKGIGRIICDMEDLPPGTFRNHPCCCIAAHQDAINNKSEAITNLLILLMQANETINSDPDCSVASAVRWIGTSQAVERMSIPTSGYSMTRTEQWQQAMNKWIGAMNTLGIFRENLRGLDAEEVCEKSFDMKLLQQAEKKLAERQGKI